MWKKSLYAALIFSSVLLVGCNMNEEGTGDNNALERGVNNAREGVDEGVNDAQRAVEDAVDPNPHDNNDNNNGNGMNNDTNNRNNNGLFDDANRNGNGADFDVNDNAVDGRNGNTGSNNGTDRRMMNENDEDIIEDRVDRNDRDNKDE